MGKFLNSFKKLGNYLWENILFIETIFLIAFIPLYPKLPLFDIKNTWVYVRADDVVVVLTFLTWLILLFRKKITLKTPLTIPIILFWLIGVIATMHGVLLVFPTLANVFPNVAFLTYFRHVEYLVLFFAAFSSIKNKNQIKVVIATLLLTLLGVVLYGIGQRYLGLPAYLTMNEEFAKGIPITLSSLSRIPSTFGGHYDLAAYLVLTIPIVVSLLFGFKNIFIRLGLLVLAFLSVVVLFMTVSRVSFFVLFVGLLFVFFFQKRKLVLLAIPLILIAGIGVISVKSSLLSRFESTVSTTDVLVDAGSGDAIGNVKFVGRDYFNDKVVLQRRVKNKIELSQAIALSDDYDYSSSSALFPRKDLPSQAALITAVDLPTGENLPQGTGYINLPLSPVTKHLSNFFYELPPESGSTLSAQVLVLKGNFVVKKASAYDLSFTTRFQGEWPRAVDAFTRNVLVGSGYGSVSLAVDNNYLRMLAETGLLGFLSFFLIFLVFGIYSRKIFPDIDSKLTKSFLIGFGGGLVALFLNAALIDVFEASKIAYTLWLLMGVSFGILLLYQTRRFDIWLEVRRAATSVYAIILYLFVVTFLVFSPALGTFFVGDDFTWLRWVADCKAACSPITSFVSYFTQADGFFYRPGAKIYYDLMYHMFWMNQIVYHFVSMLLHFGVAALLYLLARRIFKNNGLAAISAFIFVLLSGGVEAVLWISATGHLFAAFFGLAGLLLFITWREKRNYLYLLFAVISFAIAPLFQEFGVALPLLIPVYLLLDEHPVQNIKRIFMKWDYLILFVPLIGYFLLRFISNSHWSGGDYSYNILKLPFNVVGNLIGYIAISVGGTTLMPVYEHLRILMREHVVLVIPIGLVLLLLGFILYKVVIKTLLPQEKRIVLFSIGFFVVTLLPFLGLGNITSRYVYLASFAVVILLVLIIKKVYEYLLPNGRNIALGLISVGLLTFILFQTISVQQSYFEWNDAGLKVSRFFVSMDELYENIWAGNDVKFYFVDTPVKEGDAWVFPVGMRDALWFAFKNDKIEVNQVGSVAEGIKLAGLNRTHFVFQFQPDGSVKHIDRNTFLKHNLLDASQ